jgi:hypothetical protein
MVAKEENETRTLFHQRQTNSKKEQEEKKRMHKMGAWFAKPRLEYLREQIEKECISYGEIAELKSLAEYIEAGDVVLLEWAGIIEK